MIVYTPHISATAILFDQPEIVAKLLECLILRVPWPTRALEGVYP